ncbi:MAG: gliding motility-associated C-terminal domain-containing protein, partial [Flavobacteriales bacterium]|nr:gliding motility-associated C-terminal domain-containing protein [Flavobacteriales bacterium]
PVVYSFGVFDPDADVLTYSLIAAMDVGGVPLAYNFPYSGTEPITGIVIDPNTGVLNFTPTVQGNFVVVVQVQSFDANNNLIATVMRDMQFVVIPCTNTPPDPLGGAIANFSGSAIQTGDYSIEMCESNNFCFDAVFNDADANQTLTLTSNITQNLPGATFSFTGTNPVTATICWTSQPGTSGFFPFTITANDGNCPVAGIQTYVYAVDVLERTSAGPDQIICGPQVAEIEAMGGTNFTWTVLTGDPITPQNFVCLDPPSCSMVIADPNSTTTYIVTSDLAGTCINSDTITVSVVSDFSFVATQSDTLICLGETVDFNIVPTPNLPGYQFLWDPSTGLTSNTSPNPTGIYGNPGTYTYDVEVTSPDGCVKRDTSLSITVSPGYVPQVTVSQADEFVCEGGTTQFFVELDCTIPSLCGLDDGECCGPLTTQDSGEGTDSNTDTTYPAPFGHWYEGAKHQFLYRADELQALGFAGGLISQLGFNIDVVAGTSVYHEWEVKIGCTTVNELTTNNWITGLTSVFYADTLNITTGWNMFNFPIPYNWDGVSNLIVETCFNNDPYITGFTDNSHTFWTPTTFQSAAWRNQDANPNICSEPTPFQVSTNRTNTRFVFCGGVDAEDLTYTWTPPVGLDTPTSQNPFVTPQSSPATYTVTIGEAGSGCSTTEQLTVGWYPPADISFDPSTNEGVQPLEVFFGNTSASGSNTFNWDFGGLGGSQENSPSFIFNDPGTYYVTLTGLSEFGCFGSYVDSIIVLDDPIVEIPNVFSPDGDGMNDAFEYIDLRGWREANMTIFDRWGNKVYEAPRTTSNKIIWRPGNEVSEGTYYYLFEGIGNDNSEVKKQGHLTLLRR